MEELTNNVYGIRLIPGPNNVLVINQEKRHALLSNVHMTNWASSFADCREVSSSRNRMSENVLPTAKRRNQRRALPTSIHIKTTEHNATRKVAHGDVNVQHALEFGQTMVKWFRNSWHSSFYDTFSNPMVTNVLCGKMVYGQEMIYESMIVPMSSNRSVPIDTRMLTDIVFQ